MIMIMIIMIDEAGAIPPPTQFPIGPCRIHKRFSGLQSKRHNSGRRTRGSIRLWRFNSSRITTEGGNMMRPYCTVPSYHEKIHINAMPSSKHPRKYDRTARYLRYLEYPIDPDAPRQRLRRAPSVPKVSRNQDKIQ